MTALNEVRPVFLDANLDAFGRLRTSGPHTLLGLKQLYDGNPLFYDNAQVSGSGTGSTYNTNQSSTTLTVSNLTAGVRVNQSKLRGVYQPAKSFRFFGTFINHETVSGITKRVGYFDDDNGLFLESKDGIVQFVVRSYTSGAAVDTAYSIVADNGVTIDWANFQILDIDFEWLGGGRVRCALNIDGQVVYLRKVGHANNVTVVYMSNPNLPIRYEIGNDGSGPAASFTTVCSVLLSEGGEEDVAQSTYVSRGGTPLTLANQDLWTPVIAVRLKDSRRFSKINPINVDVFLTSSTNYEWSLFLNPAVAGADPGATPANWVDRANSSLEYLILRDATNLLSGGYQVAGGYGASTNQSKAPVESTVKNFLTLGQTIAGVRDEYCLGVRNIDANGGSAYGGITVGEYY